jgi:hypothetical protein
MYFGHGIIMGVLTQLHGSCFNAELFLSRHEATWPRIQNDAARHSRDSQESRGPGVSLTKARIVMTATPNPELNIL